MAYTIEKGIPIPKAWVGNGQPAVCPYPFADMHIGDSFLIADRGHLKGERAKVLRWSAAYRKQTDPTFYATTRSAQGGLRVWRVAKAAPEPPALPDGLREAARKASRRVNGGARR